MAKFSLDHLVSWMLLLFFYQFHKKPNIISQTTTEHYTCIDKFHIIKWSMFIIKSIMSMLLMFFFFLYLANLIISLLLTESCCRFSLFFWFSSFIMNFFFLVVVSSFADMRNCWLNNIISINRRRRRRSDLRCDVSLKTKPTCKDG